MMAAGAQQPAGLLSIERTFLLKNKAKYSRRATHDTLDSYDFYSADCFFGAAALA
jgi:hypothetical protein